MYMRDDDNDSQITTMRPHLDHHQILERKNTSPAKRYCIWVGANMFFLHLHDTTTF